MFVIHVFILVEHVPALIFFFCSVLNLFSTSTLTWIRNHCIVLLFKPHLNHRFNFVYHSLLSHNCYCRVHHCRHIFSYENVKPFFGRCFLFVDDVNRDTVTCTYSRCSFLCQDGAVGIATAYGLDGSRNEFQWGRDFPHLSIPALGPTQSSTKGVPFISRGKASGAWPRPPTLTGPEVKEGVDLYFNSPSAPSWKVLGWILTLDDTV